MLQQNSERARVRQAVVRYDAPGRNIMRLREFFKDLEKREIALVIFTGLVVTYVRHGWQHHWKAWDSWGDFFAEWLVNTMEVALLKGPAFAQIKYHPKFFSGYDKKKYEGKLKFIS